jgi:hypothetical protein
MTMNYLLFAGARHYPAGGAHDLIGVFAELTDASVFQAVIERVRPNRYDFDERIWVNAVSIQPDNTAAILNWEVRIEKSENHPALEFASVKEYVEGLSVCGIIPLGRNTQNSDPNDPSDVLLYPLLDPQKRDINYLP